MKKASLPVRRLHLQDGSAKEKTVNKLMDVSSLLKGAMGDGLRAEMARANNATPPESPAQPAARSSNSIIPSGMNALIARAIKEEADRVNNPSNSTTPDETNNPNEYTDNRKRGGVIKKMASGGSVSSASKRGDGIAQRGKTKGRMC